MQETVVEWVSEAPAETGEGRVRPRPSRGGSGGQLE